MAALLPRLFFEHFGPTTTIAVDSETRRIVGFVCGFVSQSDPDVAYIHFVGIDPERRGARAGKRCTSGSSRRPSHAAASASRA